MERTYIKDLPTQVGAETLINGYIDIRRDQGKMVFFDFRDMTGKVQGVVLPNNTEALEISKEIRPEWVVAVTGKVNKRPERNVQAGKQKPALGKYEVNLRRTGFHAVVSKERAQQVAVVTATYIKCHTGRVFFRTVKITTYKH